MLCLIDISNDHDKHNKL